MRRCIGSSAFPRVKALPQAIGPTLLQATMLKKAKRRRRVEVLTESSSGGGQQLMASSTASAPRRQVISAAEMEALADELTRGAGTGGPTADHNIISPDDAYL